MPAQREDLPHVSGDMGTMAFAVRSDTAAALGGTDGDYQPLITDASGRLHVLDQNSAAMAADVAETNLFTSAGKTIIANMEFLALSNTQGTTVVHANTVGSRFALMGLQGATNTTGATVTVQEVGGGTVRIGPIPTVINTTISGYSITGFPYTMSANDKGLEIVVSGSARIDGSLQFLQIANTV